jgi:hypothetical protein
MRAGEFSLLNARLHDVNAVDTKARFTLAGIQGDLQWTRGATTLASRIGWRSGALFGIGLGPADFRFGSSNGELRLDQPVPIGALGGKVILERLGWQAPTGQAGARFQFGLGMEALDLASLSQRLGWPAFTGTLAGRIPSASFQDDVLTLDGGCSHESVRRQRAARFPVHGTTLRRRAHAVRGRSHRGHRPRADDQGIRFRRHHRSARRANRRLAPGGLVAGRLRRATGD